uniref:Secreted protein n=1 Tax=Arion vulgaris TaxID=1028688 RepID=A0A0B6Y1B7_9EUPU
MLQLLVLSAWMSSVNDTHINNIQSHRKNINNRTYIITLCIYYNPVQIKPTQEENMQVYFQVQSSNSSI